jgi:hypothetical protein
MRGMSPYPWPLFVQVGTHALGDQRDLHVHNVSAATLTLFVTGTTCKHAQVYTVYVRAVHTHTLSCVYSAKPSVHAAGGQSSSWRKCTLWFVLFW